MTTLPYTFTDGTGLVGEGAQVMSNLIILKEAIECGAWTATTLDAKVEEGSGETVRSRLEGSVVRLRGRLIVKAGQTVESQKPWTTLAAAHRPSKKVLLPYEATILNVNTTGIITTQAERTAGANLLLDSITFSVAE